MATHRALIIGGSVGGLFAAHMLGRIGWEVDLFERAGEDLAGRGAGIGTHPALHEVMRRLELAFDDSLYVATGAYVCWDNADRLIHEVRQQRMMIARCATAYAGPGIIAAWSASTCAPMPAAQPPASPTAARRAGTS
jgi:2-polyprenyl-6-methoxyphenol hydroxylase-like FAD-dependent oxidoreductase